MNLPISPCWVDIAIYARPFVFELWPDPHNPRKKTNGNNCAGQIIDYNVFDLRRSAPQGVAFAYLFLAFWKIMAQKWHRLFYVFLRFWSDFF